ncbi:MAG TPA: histidine kinase dimerization/phospho-acceptor domain-containing protein, partial [Vicinamibacterales bacterium]|nr:histidine kinase dimerization/phospho-acceptor domain-containing protein [Vicinamibacterales bacterium]
MSADPRQLRPFLRVALPVAVAAVFVFLAILNVALVKTWRPEAEDGVLWVTVGKSVVASDVPPESAGARAGIRADDELIQVDGTDIQSVQDLIAIFHDAVEGQRLEYVVMRNATSELITVPLQLMPSVPNGLYFSLALVGIMAIVVGASVRLRRPNDSATLHFFWLTVAFFGGFAFTISGRLDRLDYFFYWADAIAWLALPPMFLHFALVFPERPNAWVRTDAGRAILPIFYVPALLLGGARVWLMAGRLGSPAGAEMLQLIETLDLLYLVTCLLAGLALMVRALTRLRSVTARRQLRWIVWGSSVGAVPFVLLYVVPFLAGRSLPLSQYTAVLLGCIPLSFASAIVRYRLMDIEVILKKGLVVTAVGLLLVLLYGATLELAALVLGTDQERSSFWALLATLVVVVVAPWLWNAIQGGLDRLYYRDRYDYRRALLTFARELNTELDLNRLSSRLVERIRETLGVDRFALLVPDHPAETPGRFVPVASEGFDPNQHPVIAADSTLSARLLEGQTVVIDDPVPLRRMSGDDAAPWRDVGLYSFVPCVSKEGTIAVLAAGRRPHGEPLNSEDMSLLGAVAGQAAAALENARLYGQLESKAREIERLREFGDSVVESLSDGLVVVDLEERVLRWNRRMEALLGIDRGRAVGRKLETLFEPSFVESLQSARRDTPAGATLRVPLAAGHGAERRMLLVNASIAPFQTQGGQAGWILVVEDITDRANLEEQLRLSEKMAAIGLLAAGVAHEVNTPLTGISSFTQMLLERAEPNDPKTQLLEKIERQTFRAAKIISSLLNLARPSTSDAGPVDLNAVIGDVLSLLEHQFRTSKIQVRKELVGNGAVVRGVEYKLQQVFLNLFLNARDAMPR